MTARVRVVVTPSLDYREGIVVSSGPASLRPLPFLAPRRRPAGPETHAWRP